MGFLEISPRNFLDFTVTKKAQSSLKEKKEDNIIGKRDFVDVNG